MTPPAAPSVPIVLGRPVPSQIRAFSMTRSSMEPPEAGVIGASAPAAYHADGDTIGAAGDNPTPFTRRPPMTTAARALATLVVALALGVPTPAAAQDSQMSFAVHVTLAPKWLDPAETESAITPFLVLYPLHDAMVKLMPNGMQPSLAESWVMAKDGLSYDFVLRPGVKFHNGEPVTAEDVKFSFDRYKGGGAKLLK